MEHRDDLNILEVLKHINPGLLSYQDWLSVGMALKDAGYSVGVWDEWSSQEARYRHGECDRKWNGFNGAAQPVTLGTIVHLAQQQGWQPERAEGRELDWDDAISEDDDDLKIIDANWVEECEVIEPGSWDPIQQITLYLSTLFEASEIVGYVTESWQKDNKYLPTKGAYDRSAGELIQALNSCNGDIGAVFGDYKPEAGAWIRFNPLDGKGAKNDNVTEYRYALVESDDMTIDKQNAIIRELELPVACLVYSGGKSLHAIVKVEAGNYEEYRKRVDYLYNVCKKNGLTIDTQNKNPSRLSRMPGVTRNGKKQFIIDTNIGKESWDEWEEWIEGINDNLPDFEPLSSVWDTMPELAPELISGVLREGHKMLIAGPSKAGKSFLLINLVIAIAEGGYWIGQPCKQGRVLYINLELDRASCLHRFKDVYTTLNLPPKNLCNIDIWNLRGESMPMDKLAPKLIRRAGKKGYQCVVIDPIYKVITGDENSADQMANFCNQFDKICKELGTAVIYCHHHSKGFQGSKRSMDRASGSGVFARDPDAIIDLIQLELTEDVLRQEENRAVCLACTNYLNQHYPEWDKEISQDDALVDHRLIDETRRLLGEMHYRQLQPDIQKAKKRAHAKTAWRIDGTLREFPKFASKNLWFDYPVHSLDISGVLGDIEAETEQPYRKAVKKHKANQGKRENDRKRSVEVAIEACSINGDVTSHDIAEYMGVTEKTARRYIKEHGGYDIQKGIIVDKES